MNAVILYRIDSAKGMYRYYRIEIQPDLFGEWCLMRQWGRIGRAGQMRSVSFQNPSEADAALQRQRGAKERRGYSVDAD